MTGLEHAVARLDAAVGAEIDAAVIDQQETARRLARLRQLRADVAQLADVPGPAPAPDGSAPVGPAILAGGAVKIGDAVLRIDVVDPPTGRVAPDGRRYDGGRGPNELVAYTAGGVRTGTNAYGVEVPVVNGLAGLVTDGRAGGLLVPLGGVVLSGHGAAAQWLRDHVRPGSPVEFVAWTAPAGGGQPVPAVAGATLAVYLMDGVGHVSQIPSQVNQARVAFLQGGSLVEWGGDTPADTARDLTAWRTDGRRTLVSVGGQGGAVSMGSVVGAFHTIETVAPHFPINGPDWDVEGGRLDVAQAVAVSRELARGRGDSWTTSFVPPGGDPVPVYLDAARQCQQAGLRVEFGQQLYDAEVSLDAALGALAKAVNVLGPESVLVGMMVGSDAKHWTVDQCVRVMEAAVTRWPKIGGAYLWESSRPGTVEWARRVGAVLGL